MLISAMLFASLSVSFGQKQYLYELSKAEMSKEMSAYLDDMRTLGQNLDNASSNQLDAVERSLNILDAKWNGLFQSRYDTILEDNALLSIADDYESARTFVTGAVEKRRTQIEKAGQFNDAEELMTEQLEAYEKLREQAFKLSLVKQSAELLEQLKTKEQLGFADIMAAYQTAKDAASINPGLNERMEALQDTFIKVQRLSSEIQQMEFKPLVARAKDYLMSIAAVSIIMMFIVFIGNYVKTAKQARESAKKMAEMLHDKDEDIPQI